MLSILVTSLLALPAADAVKAADNAMDAADFLGALKLLEGLDTGSATPLVLERAALLRAECLVTLQRPGSLIYRCSRGSGPCG